MNKLKYLIFGIIVSLSLTGCTVQDIKDGYNIATQIASILREDEQTESSEELILIETQQTVGSNNTEGEHIYASSPNLDKIEIPEWAGSPFVEINNNIPFFTFEEKKVDDAFEYYADLDELLRCQLAYANVCLETMPEFERGSINEITPSGWDNKKYSIVDGGWIYNRCHLIGWQLTAEDDNECNLITGTRYLNIQGMLPFENKVAKYITDNDDMDYHVLYRVTPLFNDNDLVASGVLMEGYSIEDKGKGIQFCVYCYNVQPGITIDYKTGNNWLNE